MENSRILLSYHDLNIEVETTPGNELLEHMYSTVLGQPGGMRYKHTDLEDRLNSGKEDYFLFLRKSGKMLGSVGFCGKPTVTAGFEHDSWLIRYFSIKAPLSVMAKKRKTREELKDENKRSTVLGRFIQPVFADPARLRDGKTGTDQASIIFAIIDRTNLRSMNFSAQMGLDTIGTLAAFSFSRLRPRRSGRIERVEEEQQEDILKQIREYYRSYTLFYSDSIFKNNDYYIIREEGKMVAGLQIYQVTWNIVDFGGRLTNMLAGLFSHIPRLKKRIKKDEISFLAFDAIYCEPGREKVLYELMEGVLERSNHTIGMMMMDLESDLYAIFLNKKKLGVLHKVLGTSFADIRVRFIQIPEEVKQTFLNQPTYIPTYDNS